LFVPEEQARGLVSGAIPTPSPIPDWEGFRTSNGGSVADESVVQVSIQGESSRTVTLTGIGYTVVGSRALDAFANTGTGRSVWVESPG
jgi:hypothetical protein